MPPGEAASLKEYNEIIERVFNEARDEIVSELEEAETEKDAAILDALQSFRSSADRGIEAVHAVERPARPLSIGADAAGTGTDKNNSEPDFSPSWSKTGAASEAIAKA